MCVCDIAYALEMSLPAISHHLRLLRIMGLVKCRREGKMVYYSLRDKHIIRLIEKALEHYAEGR